MSFALSIKFNVRNAVIWFVEARYIVGKVKLPEENHLTLSHLAFLIFTYLKYS